MTRKIIVSLVLTVFTALAVHSRAIYDDVYDVKNFCFRSYDEQVTLLITGVMIDSEEADEVSPDTKVPPFSGVSVMIRCYDGPKKNVRIPPHRNGVPVTHIGPYVFMDKNVISVDIPDSVTYIGLNTFTRSGIDSVTIPNSVTYIEHMAFSECMFLTSVVIPASVTDIKSSAFRRCGSLASVVLPDSITFIESETFMGCALTSIDIPPSVTIIGFGAFERNRLTSLVIPNSVTTIEPRAFAGNQLTSMVIPGSVTYIGENAFERNRIARITIGANVDLPTIDEDDRRPRPAFDNGFDDFYRENGSKAGTYTLDGDTWEYTE